MTRTAAFLASAGAAGIHFGATHAHMHEYVPAGAFMLGAGIFQLAWALAITRTPAKTVVAIGGLANAGIAALWVVSRTIGLPWGHMPGTPEHIHGPDAIASFLEILAAIACVGLITGEEAPAPGILLRLAWAGALTACIFASHDPGHEQLAVIATLALAYASKTLLEATPSLERGSHEAHHRGLRARWIAAARAGFGTSV